MPRRAVRVSMEVSHGSPQKVPLEVANVEGQPLRELTTTPSVAAEADRVPREPPSILRAGQ